MTLERKQQLYALAEMCAASVPDVVNGLLDIFFDADVDRLTRRDARAAFARRRVERLEALGQAVSKELERVDLKANDASIERLRQMLERNSFGLKASQLSLWESEDDDGESGESDAK